MRGLALLVTIFLFQNVGYADSPIVKKIDSIGSVIKNRYAPDKRTVFFEFKVDSDKQSIYIESTEKEVVEEFERLINKENVPLQVHAVLLPASDLNANIYGIAKLSVSNNRTTPGHFAEMATQMLLGTPVEVLKRDRGYYLVRTPDNYLSWVDQSGIKLMTQEEFKSWKSAKKVVYTADYGYSYIKRSKSGDRVSDLVKGDILKVVGRQGRFYKLEYPDTRVAYIPVKNAMDFNKWMERPDPNAQKILETARTMIGVPYLWGGTSIKGVDCSGFTKTSYFLNGIILPRDASQQVLVGNPVDILDSDTLNMKKALANLHPGDLLFFASKDESKGSNGKITHTALYMGNGQFIQSAGLVKISSLIPDSPGYDYHHSRSLVAARRMLTAIGEPEVTRVDRHPWYK